LAIPPEVQPHVRMVQGGLRDPEESKVPGQWAVSIPSAAGKEHTLILEYAFALTDEAVADPAGRAAVPERNRPARRRRAGAAVPVPLIKPLQATRGESKVRIWCDPVVQPSLAGGSWTEQA